MNADEFAALCMPASTTLRAALAALNRTARGVLLVLHPDGRLRRTLTDGDLRRAALGHVSENAAIADLPEQPPITLATSATMSAGLALLDQHQIDHLPVVDAAGRPVDVMFRRDLTQRVWLSSPHLGEEETAFVEDAFRTNWIAPLGPHVDGFERELAAHVGVGHAAAVSSGTAAIHLALLLLGVRPGDTVFCSSLTFVGSCNPILYCGARPVFIDSEPQTWNMSPPALERALEWAKREGRLPRCVIVVNLYGQSADMEAILPLCERYGVPVLEDAAESLGARYRGRASGTFGRIGIYSFNGNKIITTSGGGMLVADDGALVERARKLATQAREPAPHYEHVEVGFNYRMSNVLAGIGRGQLKVLEQRVAQRRQVFETYRTELASAGPLLQWMPEPEGFHSTRWLTCFTLAGERGRERRDLVLRSLERHAIEARPVWKPMHLQPLFHGAPYFGHQGGDVSGQLFESGVCLPSGSNLTTDQQQRVIDELRRALAIAEDAGAVA
ncbi:aminotransferase class I/II-fold pyridoxal phosphate-dependent enzyme [Ramlibacter sp.]|uniref:aminotransferase class I/II-fold pyridoxal phosphate-dependent enzyme n=1 Tax=Ramlibacter sp. TaxID=1917967 RepID=UPI002BE1C7AC|nr:aminotransferase class I/II-fold pyridoxal phosphate-dependent enzyme [Ramlibacter sp.]HWI81359.1 aminotransferase class I/II-fold pyridoxal phosphate-dependent enzyme [Ramlibacter sp.]